MSRRGAPAVLGEVINARRKPERDISLPTLEMFEQALDDGLPENTNQGRFAPMPLARDSDVQIAQVLARDLKSIFGDVVYCEGAFWCFHGQCWRAYGKAELRRLVHVYDGITCESAPGQKGLELKSSRVNGVLKEMGAMLDREGFFDAAPEGINCASGFIEFMDDGTPSLSKHSPDQRQRHCLPGAWDVDLSPSAYGDSLLWSLLTGCFADDPDKDDKINLLGEVAAAAALGRGTRGVAPKAVFFLGRRANNGKSQMIEAIKGLLPSEAISALQVSKFGDEKALFQLRDKLLNAAGEMPTSKAITSDAFKSVITGDEIYARDVYLSGFHFRPRAQHIFAGNGLPAFQGGIDPGVRRRLLILEFNRTIPRKEAIENIGARVARDEVDYLLSFAVDGARRLLNRGRFTEPDSSRQVLEEWMGIADPVHAWLESGKVMFAEGKLCRTNTAFEAFKLWAGDEGYGNNLPYINKFTERVRATTHDISYKRTATGGVFVGMLPDGCNSVGENDGT